MTTIFSRYGVEYFFAIPPETQIIWFWFGCFAFYFATTIAIYLYFRSKAISLKPYKRFAKNFLWPNLIFSIIGLIFTFSRYEKLTLFSWRFWVYACILCAVVFNAWYFTWKRIKLEDELAKFYNRERKNKWMKKSKK